jgi:hypothetical protein
LLWFKHLLALGWQTWGKTTNFIPPINLPPTILAFRWERPKTGQGAWPTGRPIRSTRIPTSFPKMTSFLEASSWYGQLSK